METRLLSRRDNDGLRGVASLLGSGINGNRNFDSFMSIRINVASLLGSGINGNRIGELEMLRKLFNSCFLIRKWN